MNRSDDFNNLLEAWLRRQAPSQAPDRVLNEALERVAKESQRRSWLLPLVGETPMATLLRAAALTAVIAIAVLFGLQFGILVPDVGAPSPSPSAEGTSSRLLFKARSRSTETAVCACRAAPRGGGSG